MKFNQIQNQISESIYKNDPNAQAFLFGSRARGDFNVNSDWDILILVDDLTINNKIEDKFRDELYEIELENNQVISTFIYSKNYWNKNLKYSPFFENVLKESIPL